MPMVSRSQPFVLAGLILAALAGVYLTPLRHFLYGEGFESLRAWLHGLGVFAPAAFLGLCVVAVALGAPRVAFAALAGVLFGMGRGVLLAETGTLGGCLITFAVARWLGRDFVEQHLPRRAPATARLLGKIEEHGIMANLLVRAAPVGNCFSVNLLMGTSRIRTHDFLLGTLLGTLPETVIYALFGSAIGGQVVFRVTVGVTLLVILGVLHASWIRKKTRSLGPVRSYKEDSR